MERVLCNEERHPSGERGLFLLGKAEDQIKTLLKTYRGAVRLIYLDPPFRTGESFSMRIGKGALAKTIRLYEDTLSKEAYMEWMRTILTACHELLDARGSLYLHLDYRMSSNMRLLLDNIFGESNFMNEIIWTYKSGGRSKRYYPRKHDTILFYRKSKKVLFDIQAVGMPRGSERRNHMKRFIDTDGRVGFSIRSNGKIYRYFEDSLVYPSDVWSDIEHLQQKDRERTGYATQKPEALLRRIIAASTVENDLVLDLFSGSGTTAATAFKMNRRFLAVDCSPIAQSMLRKRLLSAFDTACLLDDSSRDFGFSMQFHPDSTPCDLIYKTFVKNGSTYIEIQQAAFESDPYPLVYAAIGTISNSVFTACSVNCAPYFPIRFKRPDGNDPGIQVTDAIGRTAFFRI